MLHIRGEKNKLWNGNTPLFQTIRKSIEYKLWRKKIFQRDNYTCQFCGIRSCKGKKVELHADHIKPFALYAYLRFNLSNGRTLCKQCHLKTDTYGNKIKKYKITT